MAKEKYYVVWKGLKPGIYTQWTECEKQIKAFVGAAYKSFPDKMQAEKAFKENPYKHIGTQQAIKKDVKHSHKPIIESIAVDAACSGNPGIMEYRGVHTATKKELFHKGPFEEGTNNIGEFLALVHGLAYLKKNNFNIPLYTDSVSALSWVRNKKIKTTLEKSSRNKELFDLMDRALNWLEQNKYQTQIIKWDTKNWGEIPADFGRK